MVCVGVVLGGYFLNMAGAAILSSNSSNWTYVLGPDKCNQSSVNSLINSITSGADVKILLVNNKFQQECTAVEVMSGSEAGTFDIVCFLSNQKIVLIGSPESVMENISEMMVNTSNPCEMRWNYSDDRVYANGSHSFSNGDVNIVPIKWVIRK